MVMCRCAQWVRIAPKVQQGHTNLHQLKVYQGWFWAFVLVQASVSCFVCLG